MHPRALLRKYGYTPRKRLGQHFLTDSAAAARIARLAADAGDAAIVEIGAGTGTLTGALLDLDADVTAIELDPAMVRILTDRKDLSRAAIVHADALSFDYAPIAARGRWRVTGNLPYNVATPLVLKFVEMRDGPEAMIVMVQKDVAERFAARPGNASYGSLSIALQYAMDVRRAFTLPPSRFYPQPKVDSAVVELRRLPRPAVAVRDEHRFLQVVRAAFAYRRKTLANSVALALGCERASVTSALLELNYDPEIRGEQLDLAGFARLADCLPA